MTTHWIIYTCLASGLACALVAGVFQAFSDFVMKGLISASPSSGITAMQMINITVFKSVFIVMMLGLAPSLVFFSIYAYVYQPASISLWVIIGTAIYVPSVFLVTMFGNVPMNNTLARTDHTTLQAKEYWHTYVTDWTRWNHARTFGALASALCFLFASTRVL